MSVEVRLENFTPEERALAFETVGRFVHAVSELDLMISALVAALMGLSEVGAHEMLVHSIDLNRKCEILRTIAAFAPEREEFKTVRRIVKFTQRANERRNIAAHGILGEVNGKIAAFTVNFSRVLSPGGERALVFVDRLPPLIEQAGKRSEQASELVAHFESHMSGAMDARRTAARLQKQA